MSSINVYNALSNATQNGSINLWETAQNSPDLAGLRPVLGLLGISSSWILQGVDMAIAPDGQSVQMSAAGSFNGTTAYPAGAVLRYLQQNNQFTLTLSLSGDWTFTGFFGTLPDTFMQNPPAGVGIFWNPSVFNGLTVRHATFSGTTGEESLRMTGYLLEPNNALLLQKTPMIGPYPLRLSGTVQLPDATRNYPLVDLDAVGNATIINGAKQPGVDGPDAIALLNPGLRLLIQPLIPAQNDRVAFSTIRLFADFALGEIRGRISTLILSMDTVWSFTVVFRKETASLVQGLAQLTRLFGVELPIPMNFPVLSDFYVAEIDIDLQNTAEPGAFPSFTLLNFAITIKSDKTWDPPLPFITFSKVGVRWVWSSTLIDSPDGTKENSYLLSGSVFGNVNFGGGGPNAAALPGPGGPPPTPGAPAAPAVPDTPPVSIRTILSIPDFILSGKMEEDSYIPIGQALSWFFNNTGPRTGPQTMNIIGLQFTADPLGGNYFANASILFGDPLNPDPQQGWEIDLGLLTILLNLLEFDLAVNNGRISGSISGTFYLDVANDTDYTLPRLMISASYPPQDPENPEGWTLSGHLYPGTSISLTKLLYQFIYGKQSNPPAWTPDVTVDRLDAVLTTGSTTNGVTTNPSYTFGGTVSARWTPPIFGNSLKISAAASLDLEKPANTAAPSGRFTCSFSVNKLMVNAGLTFGVPEPTYLFKVQFDQLWLEATTSWRGEQNNRHQVISLQLGGITLGDILEYLVNLAAPTQGFRLEAPWDILKQVDLSRFVLTIDPQDNIVEFIFRADVDLVVARLDAIGVRYSKPNGEGKVNMILTGQFMGQQYTEEKPLTWDVINEPPPAVPGQGSSLVNLRYLALGQRVTFNGDAPDTVAESIALLRQNMPPPPADGDPMPGTMRYAADSQWLIGLDIQLMETVDLAIIFNDPRLYGLSIALGGEKAGSLAGLRFEILYKKITDDIGMFRVELRVPDAFRTIQLGVVSITLGIIVVEIYTNGNFKVDLGFPYNRNFDRSFSLQAAIFIGRGGFYLGVLNGDTSTQVPRISNGNFSPVIELGIGIAAGVGREVRAGILSGGAYVELQVIFQGVLAWFNPNSSGASPARFFRCQGIAALHGKVYGSVDFSVIKVTVTLEAYAQVSILYECYQPMLITLTVDVSAEASVRILFFSISFSFHVNLQLDFKLGSAQPTPWILAGNGSPARSQYGIRTHPYRRIQALMRTHLAASGLLASPAPYTLQWDPSAKVFPDAPRKAHLTLLPSFTIADVPVNWDGTVPANTQPNYRAAFLLFGDNGMSANAQTAAACTARSAAHSGMAAGDQDTSSLAADILAQGLLTYALNAIPRSSQQGNNITSAQIASLLQQLDAPQTMSTGLSIDNLNTFFQTNINLWISGDTQPLPNPKGAMVLPLPPFLAWNSNQGGNPDFSAFNKIGPWYEWGISQLQYPYFPVAGPLGDRPAQDDPTTYESFTSYLFRDFCRLLIQNGVKEAQKMLSSTTVIVQKVGGIVQNLAQVAATLPTAQVTFTLGSGDTLESVALTLGATVEELVFLNPRLAQALKNQPVGAALDILLGIAPEVLALDNPDTTFALTQCALGTLVHQAAQNETLQQIATLFQVADLSTLLSYQDQDDTYPVLSTGSNILLAGSTFNLASQTYTGAPADFVQLRTAAAFFVRYLDLSVTDETPIPDMAAWYVQAIATFNQQLLQTLFPDQSIPTVTELPPGHVLNVPNQFNNAYTQPGSNNPYTTIPGDTLYRIGFTLVFSQDFGAANIEKVPQWVTFRTGVVAAGNQTWTIPAWNGIRVETGSTIAALVRRLILNATWTNTDPQFPANGTWTYNWTNIAIWLGQANVLAPLASITVPDAQTAPNSVLSFRTLSDNYGLEITDAAQRLSQVPGLYGDQTVLQVKWLPTQDIGVLVSAVAEGSAFVSIVNQSSRMFMSGLQLPALTQDNGGHTIPDPTHPFPLYDLTGQQFNLTLDPLQPTQTALTLSLTAQQGWITLFNSITVVTGQTLAQLEAAYPNLLTYNPGLNESNFHVGMILLTAATPTLDYSYTNGYILGVMPDTGLAISPIPPTPAAPSLLPLKGTIARTYGLQHRIELQTPDALPIPQASGQDTVTGNAGLWILPEELQAKARSGSATAYEILSAATGGEAGKDALQLDNSTFGALIPFRVKKLDNSNTLFNLIGVDTDSRDLLISLSNWLKMQPPADTTKAFLMLSPAPDAHNTSGLTGLTSAPASVFLIKTNLSTQSVPPRLRARQTPAGDNGNAFYFSNLSSLADFLVLLWEGSVVGGIGYYFSPGQELPGSAFDQQGNITLQLLVIAGTQQSIAPNGRTLLSFNNCALIGTQAYGTSMSLFVQSAGSEDPSETIAQALIPPGNAGIQLLIDNPFLQQNNYPVTQIMLKELYSLLSFAVVETQGSPFIASASGMPILPTPVDGSSLQPWQRDRRMRKLLALGKGTPAVTAPLTVQPYWKYEQVMPVSRFLLPGTEKACPPVAGLPPASQDPYQGYGTQSQLPYAYFSFAFGDVLGNRSGSNGTGQGLTQAPVGYTDNLIGIGDWPSIARYFTISGDAPSAQLGTVIMCRPSECLPTPSEKGDVHQERLQQQQERYASIYYQLIQPNVEAWMVTSLQYITDSNYGNKGTIIEDPSPLWRFAAGSYAFVTALSALPPADPLGISTLGDIISIYGVRYTELAQANADTAIQALFGNALPQVPAFFPFVEHLSITSLLPLIPPGWPSPATAYDLLTMQANTGLPLRAATVLTIPAVTIPTGSTSPTPSLQSLADANHTTPVLLATQNATQPILQTGFHFTIAVSDTESEVIVVDQNTDSFQLVVTAFAGKGVQTTVEALANLHKDLTGMLAIDQSLSNTFYITAGGDTLAKNESGCSIDDLATGNGNTPDLFDPGALLFLGNFANVTSGAVPPTLQEFADKYACPSELLLSANAGMTVPAQNGFVLPGTLAWPADPDGLSVPYTIQGTDTLNGIASRFHFNTSSPAALQLATNNEAMPGTLVPNIDLSIPVGGTSYNVNTGSGSPSFLSLLGALRQQVHSAALSDIVSAVQGSAGVLSAGGLLICPPVWFAQAASSSDIHSSYGVTAAAFAQANAAMQNLISPGVPLQAPGGTPGVTTRQNETFNSLVTYFAEKGINLGITEIIAANMGAALFRSGALALLPPADISFQAPLPQGGPYQSPITPLQVSIRLIRPEALIHPEFVTPSGTGPVEMVGSDFPAPAKDGQDNSGLNFNDLVASMKKAFPQLRLGTARVSTAPQDLWQVNFDSSGIQHVTLSGGTTVNAKPQPRFFALKPLYGQLVSRTVEVADLNADGSLGMPVARSFQGVDVELWARRFVADMDRFLSGGFAGAVYLNGTIRAQLNTVLGAKANLIPAVAAGLDTILDIADRGKPAALASAIEALIQQLGVSLSRAYASTLLIQYNSTVQSAWQQPGSTLPPASLYGDGTIVRDGKGIPGLTILAAKTDLSQGSSYVNFLGTLDNPGLHRNIEGDFGYAIPYLEFNIGNNNLPAGFQSSDWLSFLPLQAGTEKPPALLGTDPGDVTAPVPLRVFPALPAISGQRAAQSFPDINRCTPQPPQSVAPLSRWDYTLDYSHEHAEQDYVVIKVEFNLHDASKHSDIVALKDLFTELASYIQVADPLWNILNALIDPDDKQGPAAVENAVRTFGTLCANIGQHWGDRLSPQAFIRDRKTLMEGDKHYSFDARAGYLDGNLDTYTLTCLDTDPGPEGIWPDVYAQLPSGEYGKLDIKERDQTTTKYYVKPPLIIPGGMWPRIRLVWPQLNVASVQNARSSMYVQRNQDLIDNVHTNTAFLFQTDTVFSAGIVTPLNNFEQPVCITQLGTDLTSALNKVFTDLFGNDMDKQIITMEAGYGFELGDTGLVTYLPIGLYPDQTLSTTTAATVNTALQTWKANNDPEDKGGEWIFSLKQYSQLTAEPQTLLNIGTLVYKLLSNRE